MKREVGYGTRFLDYDKPYAAVVYLGLLGLLLGAWLLGCRLTAAVGAGSPRKAHKRRKEA